MRSITHDVRPYSAPQPHATRAQQSGHQETGTYAFVGVGGRVDKLDLRFIAPSPGGSQQEPAEPAHSAARRPILEKDSMTLTPSCNFSMQHPALEQQGSPQQIGRATWQSVQRVILHGVGFVPLFRLCPLIVPCYCPLLPSACRKQSAPHAPTTRCEDWWLPSRRDWRLLG